MTEHVQEKSKLVLKFITQEPRIPQYRADLLIMVNRAITSLGYDWDTIPADKWIEVYQNVGTLSPQRLRSLQKVINEYYLWLDDQEIMSYKKRTYRPPDYTKVFASEMHFAYPSTLDSLYDMYDLSLANTRKLPHMTVEVNKAVLGFVWMGLNLDEIVGIEVPNITFYDKENSALFPTASLSDVYYGSVRTSIGELTFANEELLRCLFALWSESATHSTPDGVHRPLFNPGKDAPLTTSNLNIRLFRLVNKINETCYVNFTVKAIRLAGAYDRAFALWVNRHLPWYYTPQNADIFFTVSRIACTDTSSHKQLEFQKFIEFVRAFHPEAIH